MMVSAQLAHGEYDKYIVTYLKHKKKIALDIATGCHARGSVFPFISIEGLSWVIVRSGSEPSFETRVR